VQQEFLTEWEIENRQTTLERKKKEIEEQLQQLDTQKKSSRTSYYDADAKKPELLDKQKSSENWF